MCVEVVAVMAACLSCGCLQTSGRDLTEVTVATVDMSYFKVSFCVKALTDVLMRTHSLRFGLHFFI